MGDYMEEFTEDTNGLEADYENVETKFESYAENGVDTKILTEAVAFLKSEIGVISKITSYEEGIVLSGMDSLLFRYFLKKTNPVLYDQVDKISFIVSDAIKELVTEEKQKGDK